MKPFASILQTTLFHLQQTPVTLASLLSMVLFILTAWVISRVAQRLLRRRVFPHFRLDLGLQFTLSRLFHYFVMFLAVIFSLQFIGLSLTSLAFVAGLLSVGIGFGLQNIANNFISGLILLFERPIAPGDRVTVGETSGDVREIRIRSTTIVSPDNITIIVPNSQFIMEKITNWSYGDPRIRLHLPVSVGYKSDLNRTKETLLEVARTHSQVLPQPAPEVWLTQFGDSGIQLELLVWVAFPKGRRRITSDLSFQIHRLFTERGIEIPFPQREITIKKGEENPERLKGRGEENK